MKVYVVVSYGGIKKAFSTAAGAYDWIEHNCEPDDRDFCAVEEVEVDA